MKRSSRWRTAREMALTIVLVCIARTGFAAPFYVSSGSMQPTLLIGDHMLAEPFAYGFSTASLPFGDALPVGGRLFGTLPAQGDVVVFRGPAEPDTTWVKRVIGRPGDHVGLKHGRLFLNGRQIAWQDGGEGQEELADGTMVPAERFTETLPDGLSHTILKRFADGPLDDVPDVLVPPGFLFVMGDNRDNSADSRVPVAQGGVGLLPIWNLQGRVELVTASRDFVRSDGWLRTLRLERTLKLVQ